MLNLSGWAHIAPLWKAFVAFSIETLLPMGIEETYAFNLLLSNVLPCLFNFRYILLVNIYHLLENLLLKLQAI